MRKSEIRILREQKIISLLSKMGIVDVEIIKRLNVSGLGDTTDRNVLRVLNRMVDDGHLDSIRKETKLYCMKDRGFGHYEHRLMMNKFLVRKGLVKVARIEPNIKIGNDEFRPDFIVPVHSEPKTEKDWVFYEVDRVQKKKVNMQKVERYKRLGLRFEVVCSGERNHMWKGCVIHNV